MSWAAHVLRSLFGTAPKDGDRVELPALASMLPAEEAATVSRALAIAGVTNQEPETLAFYEGVSGGFINYKDLIRSGPLLTSDQKKARGIRSRAHVGETFADTLNEAGLADLQTAACRIAFTFNKQRQCIADLGRTRWPEGEDRLRFVPSNMAAGPCSPAKVRSGDVVTPHHAALLPLDGCEHPDQCSCRYLPLGFGAQL